MTNENTHDANQLVIFPMGKQLCGLRAEHVAEIIRLPPITPIHNAPEYVRGVINLRGDIVTVIDLGRRLGLTELGGLNTVIIMPFGEENIGLLTEEVDDIIASQAELFEVPPTRLSGIGGTYLDSVYKLEEQLAAVLKVAQILKIEEEAASAT